MKKLPFIWVLLAAAIVMATVFAVRAQQQRQFNVTFGWNPNPTNEGIYTYVFYWGSNTFGTNIPLRTNAVQVGNTTNYATQQWTGVRYSAHLTAVNNAGLESDRSASLTYLYPNRVSLRVVSVTNR